MQTLLKFHNLYFFILILLSTIRVSAQKDLSSDQLFIKARKIAFEEKNYPKAIAITKETLQKSPDYADIRIFLGRMYTWVDKLDSARVEFERVREKSKGYENLYIAYGYLEYWNDNSKKALSIIAGA